MAAVINDDNSTTPDLVVVTDNVTKAECGGDIPVVGASGVDDDDDGDDNGIIPRGEIDPVYEAKARVLNRAVGNCLPTCPNYYAAQRYREAANCILSVF